MVLTRLNIIVTNILTRMNTLKKYLPDAAAVVLFLLISLAYFFTPLSEGLVLGGHDAQASIGQGRENMEYTQRTGETTRWVNNVFSGMPTYQIAPSYKSSSFLGFFQKIYAVGTSGPLCYLFLFLLGFYILLRAFNFKPYLAALGAILWAFSSYFLIIMAAGHIWKVMTLTFIPPTIAGLVLCYRGRYLWGGVVTALFTAFQIQANHVQMSYYFVFLMLFIVVAYGIDALRKKEAKTWLKATGVILVAGLLGIAANLPNLYHTWQYSKASIRGAAELSPLPQEKSQNTNGGLDRDYITQWSYGVDETLTLLIPDFKGGGSSSILDRPDATDLEGYDQFYQCAGATQQALQQSNQQATPPGLIQYWGEQPMTVGPVYVGAFVCFLFILGLFFVKGPIKWALLGGTLLSFLFAWGHNSPAFTNFCIDHLPMYNKFRTPSSALVVAEFTMPLLAIMALARILREPRSLWANRREKVGLIVSSLLTAGLCLMLTLFPSLAGNCISSQDQQVLDYLTKAGGPEFTTAYSGAITSMHHAILSASALRSFFVILLGGVTIGLYYLLNKNREKAQGGWWLVLVLGVISIVDLWGIDKRYLNNESFTDPVQLQNLTPTAADRVVMQDKADGRVLDISQGNPFNETSNHSGYFHQSIGGYNAVKLRRYQDLIDRQLNNEMSRYLAAISEAEGDMKKVPGDSLAPVLNMLNTRYLIFGANANQAVRNPYANGNGWFVRTLRFVKGADAEMAGLTGLDTKHAAVADEKFRAVLEGSPLDSGSIQLTSRQPNELHYQAVTPKGGVAVLSEIYYPGWEATIDGKPTDIGRVNYVLRAIKVPAGKHELVLTYRPASVSTTETVAFVSIALILVGFIAAFVIALRKPRKEEEPA